MAEQSIIEKNIKLETAVELLDAHVETLRLVAQCGNFRDAGIGKDYRVTKSRREAFLSGKQEEQIIGVKQ